MALNELLSQLTRSSLGSIVNVRISAEMAHNLDAMQRTTANVLAKLGCEGCHSGFDIRYDVLRDFVADEKGEVRSIG